jgi:hypothetical protein
MGRYRSGLTPTRQRRFLTRDDDFFRGHVQRRGGARSTRNASLGGGDFFARILFDAKRGCGYKRT